MERLPILERSPLLLCLAERDSYVRQDQDVLPNPLHGVNEDSCTT